MDNRLKISKQDWGYIFFLGVSFSFVLSLFFFFMEESFRSYSTIFFAVTSAIVIVFFSFVSISISNNFILPRVKPKLWYVISFIFAFLSGFLGFYFSFNLFLFLDTEIANLLNPFSFYLNILSGFLTLFIGFILHQFVSVKYKNEYMKNEILSAKLKALENELNPHFLFNALNSVCQLIYEDPKKAENVVVDISKFLRNAISKSSLISLKEEMEMVKTYVQIENIRFNEQIVLTTKIEDETILVPKFSIQLLIENAIKHGFDDKVLNIRVKSKENKIAILNDGKKLSNMTFGTGLMNLENRLKILCNGDLKYKNDKDIEFIISLEEK